MVAKHGPASIDNFHRNQTEACRPRPIAIDLGEGGFLAIDKIVRWTPGTPTTTIWTTDKQAVAIYDTERRVDAMLRTLFQVAVP